MDTVARPISISEDDAIAKAKLSVIIPVYNEESEILAVINRIRENLILTSMEFEIIVVNDGSTDNTLAILEAAQKVDRRIRAVTYAVNRGKGFAVKTGILESKGDLGIYLDGDLDISPDSIQNFVKALEECDLVIGSKRHPLSVYQCPTTRKILSRCFYHLVKLLVSVKVSDTQVGLKGGKSVMLKYIFSNIGTRKYAFDVEFLKLASLLKLKVNELPVTICMTDKFKVKDIFFMARDLARISWRYRIRKHHYSEILNGAGFSVQSGPCKNATILPSTSPTVDERIHSFVEANTRSLSENTYSSINDPRTKATSPTH